MEQHQIKIWYLAYKDIFVNGSGFMERLKVEKRRGLGSAFLHLAAKDSHQEQRKGEKPEFREYADHSELEKVTHIEKWRKHHNSFYQPTKPGQDRFCQYYRVQDRKHSGIWPRVCTNLHAICLHSLLHPALWISCGFLIISVSFCWPLICSKGVRFISLIQSHFIKLDFAMWG